MLKNILIVIAIFSAFLLGLLMNFNILYDDLKLIVPPAIAGLIAIGSVWANYLISEKQQKTQIKTTIEKEWRANVLTHTAQFLDSMHTYDILRGLDDKTEKDNDDSYEAIKRVAMSYTTLKILVNNVGDSNIAYRNTLKDLVDLLNKRIERNEKELIHQLELLIHKIDMPKGN